MPGIDVVLLDLRIPGSNGIDLLQEIKRRRPEAVVVIMAGYATVHSAVQAMKAGAYDYISKPFTFDELRLVLDRVTAHLKLAEENRVLRDAMRSKHGFGPLIGRAPEMERLYRIIAKAANSSHPVLILGESGTGKELVARAIHFGGGYRDRPFIPVDCGTLVPTLIESELFGYVRGAFTGASRAKDGLLATADGGTIFLDEVGDCPSICNPSCCAPSRRKRFVRWVATGLSRSMCASWRPPTAILSRRFSKARFAGISSSGSMY